MRWGKGWRIFALKVRKIPQRLPAYRSAHTLLLAVLTLSVLASCRPTRRLAEDEYLLDRNHIEVAEDSLRFNTEKLRPIIKQSPNKRILGFIRFHMGVHNIANNGNDSSKVRKWLMEDVGEAPVVHDTAKTRRTVEQMETYLTKKGYFASKVEDSIGKDVERQRIEVHYLLRPGSPYRFGEISYDLEAGVEGEAKGLIQKNTELKEGSPFDIETLEQEREKLAELLRKNGYYSFTKSAIHFELDSSVGKRKVAVELEVRPEARRVSAKDTVTTHPHRPWRIRNIMVHTDRDPSGEESEEKKLDTLRMKEGYAFVYREELRIDPSLLVQSIYVKPGASFNAEEEKITYRRLSELRVFRSVNISYDRVKGQDGVLDCRIQLTRSKTHSLSLETRGTNRGGNLGISGNVTYKNRNIFRGAETFAVDLNGGVESQPTFTEGDEEERKAFSDLELNTVEFGPELSLDFPKFLLPVDPTRFARSSDPHTRLSASMNFQKRPDYTRNVASMSLDYRWDETDRKKHEVEPIGLSMIRIDKSRAFQERLEAFNDQLLLNSYQNHLIFGSQYSFTYNDQESSDQENIHFFKGNFEAAGNSLQLFHENFAGEPGPEERHRIGGIGFSQFMKMDVDLRYYHRINSKSSMAFRAFGGIGVPYGNSDVLPFQRSFYGGGANGIRAWRIRTLGPGSFTDPSSSLSFDKIGDIKLEGNAEYRFDLIDPVEGAFFVDGGNIWLIEENERRPGGAFKSDDVINEIAVGAGFGLRLDLNFFIIRLDLAVPVKDPELPVGERWLFQPKDRTNRARQDRADQDPDRDFDPYRPLPNLSLGIGYPF